MKTLRIKPNEIQKKYSIKLKTYKDKWGYTPNITEVPHNVNEYNIRRILDYMIETGYSFIIAAYIVNNSLIKVNTPLVMEIKDLKNNWGFSKPRDTKVKLRIKNILENNELKAITIGSDYRILDGYATLVALKQLNETHCICVINDECKSHTVCKMSDIRQELYIEQNGRCYICGRKTKLDPRFEKDELFATVDHIVPRSKGGSTSFENCKLCCRICNSLKADLKYSDRLKSKILSQIKR